jgi:hypothetical protein
MRQPAHLDSLKRTPPLPDFVSEKLSMLMILIVFLILV